MCACAAAHVTAVFQQACLHVPEQGFPLGKLLVGQSLQLFWPAAMLLLLLLLTGVH
jgi:hypothetical protein